jgi:hypothetical protein
MFREVDAFKPPIEGDVDPFVDKPFTVHAFARPGFPEQICHTLLDHTCTDSSQNVVATAAFQDDRVDALKMEQPRKQ